MKTVCGLSREELNELKEDCFYHLENDIFDVDINCPEDIPDDFIFNKYADTTFTYEDFFCNVLPF